MSEERRTEEGKEVMREAENVAERASRKGKVKIMTPKGLREVEVGLPFAPTVRRIAQDVGLSEYRVFVRGVEILDPGHAPATIELNQQTVLYPYDVAA